MLIGIIATEYKQGISIYKPNVVLYVQSMYVFCNYCVACELTVVLLFQSGWPPGRVWSSDNRRDLHWLERRQWMVGRHRSITLCVPHVHSESTTSKLHDMYMDFFQFSSSWLYPGISVAFNVWVIAHVQYTCMCKCAVHLWIWVGIYTSCILLYLPLFIFVNKYMYSAVSCNATWSTLTILPCTACLHPILGTTWDFQWWSVLVMVSLSSVNHLRQEDWYHGEQSLNKWGHLTLSWLSNSFSYWVSSIVSSIWGNSCKSAHVCIHRLSASMYMYNVRACTHL